MNKIWILRPIHTTGDDPWDPWYDKSFGFIVRAETEDDARKFAHKDAGDENRGEFLSKKIAKTKKPWLDPKYSTCVELGAEGDAGVLMKDFAAA